MFYIVKHYTVNSFITWFIRAYFIAWPLSIIHEYIWR